MSKKLGIVIIVLCVIALGLSVTSIVITTNCSDKKEVTTAEVQEETGEEDTQYVLYLGTNDKDTNEPVFDTEESKEKLKEILIDYFGGYTIQEAYGGWKDEETIYQEYTLVIYLSDTNIEDVHKVCDKFIETFNQSSVLIQANKTVTEFYAGE